MTRARAGRTSEERLFRRLLVGVLALRLVLAVALPVTGDEAYFYYWGKWPDFGFYDHPPMVGWLLALLSFAGESRFSIRLPSVLLVVPVALAVVALVRPATGPARAWLAGIAVLATPAEWLNVLISTDTPLVFFAMATVLAYARAVRAPDGGLAWYAAAGIMLGAALASKYFAGLLALGLAGFVVASPRAERRWRGLAVTAAFSLPLVVLTVWWNAEHCWANVMFNLYNRHEGSNASWRTPLLYVATLAYASSPVLLWQLARHGRAALAAAPSAPERAVNRLLVAVTAVPLAIFAVLSVPKTIGLHWLFAFTPLLFALGARLFDAQALRTNIKWLAALSAVHLAGLAVFAVAPTETWARAKIYPGLVMTVHTGEVLAAALAPYDGAAGFTLASDSYSNAVTYGFAARRYFAVFGEASSHARHDDILTDYRMLDGKDILVLRKSEPPPADYTPYFERVEQRSFTIRGVRFWTVAGYGFRYPAYRDRVLATIRDKYYRIPAFLPQAGCYFCDRYFGMPACPTR